MRAVSAERWLLFVLTPNLCARKHIMYHKLAL